MPVIEYEYVRLRGMTYIHTCRSYVHTPRDHVFGRQRVITVNVVKVVAHWPIRPIWASGGAKFTKMEDFLPWMPLNRRAKLEAAGFVLGGEICNRTNKQTNTKQ